MAETMGEVNEMANQEHLDILKQGMKRWNK